jgi:hypothetical protein
MEISSLQVNIIYIYIYIYSIEQNVTVKDPYIVWTEKVEHTIDVHWSTDNFVTKHTARLVKVGSSDEDYKYYRIQVPCSESFEVVIIICQKFNLIFSSILLWMEIGKRATNMPSLMERMCCV